MVEKIRKDAGKSAEPHYALIDSQSVKTVADNEKRGIDGGKKAKGRKRHAVIDTMGNLLGIVVHAANIHDTKSGILAAQKACKKYPSIQAFCADAGYRGTCIDEVKVTPHNSAARLAMSFPPSAACKFLDLPPVNLRNLHLHLTKNPFASRPPYLRGVTLELLGLSLLDFLVAEDFASAEARRGLCGRPLHPFAAHSHVSDLYCCLGNHVCGNDRMQNENSIA